MKEQKNEISLIRKIVVATDFSRASKGAFTFSIHLAKQMDAEVVSIFVKDADDLAIALRQNLTVRHKDLKRLKSKVNKVIEDKFQSLLKDEKGDHPVRFVIREGNPVQEILKVAKREKADLIVTGTRGRALLSDLLLGSTARELILNSVCPVITINEKSQNKT